MFMCVIIFLMLKSNYYCYEFYKFTLLQKTEKIVKYYYFLIKMSDYSYLIALLNRKNSF